MKVAAVASLNGFVFAEEYDGLVTVNPDRTSLVTFLIPLPGAGPVPFVFRGVISDNHQQHDIILESVFGAPPASTVTISLRRQNRSNCSNNNLNGGYALTMRGFVNPPPGSPVPPTPRAPRPRRARSCEFTMNFGGNAWSGVLMDNGAGANLMVSVPNPPGPEAPPAYLGAAVSGTLKKQ